jgi:DNA-directed DNA polymerase III PolC
MNASAPATDREVPPAYVELHCCSNFSFLRGASRPEELVAQAQALSYTALALTDECSLAGVVRAHLAARDLGFKFIIGSEFKLTDGPRLVLLATDRAAYGNLSELITQARRAAKKGSYRVTRPDVAEYAEGCLALWLPDGEEHERNLRDGQWMARVFPGRAWIAVEFVLDGRDHARLASLTDLGQQLNLPLVAAGDAHMHARDRRPLQDVLTAIRLGTTVEATVPDLHPNGERCLRPRKTLAKLFPPEMLAETMRIAERCNFSLDELRYEYPEELVPSGQTPASHLRTLTETGLQRRWPRGAPLKVRKLVEHELALIAELRYEPYFLTVHDIVNFARARGILCQGRGSAANSAVCFCLGVTEVDPARIETLFERFVSKERNEPPDIDVDFEHERREEVIQYIYGKYGRSRAALAATVITYRPKSAVRDVGKALGFSLEQVDSLAGNLAWWDGGRIEPTRLVEAGFDPKNPKVQLLLQLVHSLIGFPRHLSQHVGGFVIARDKLSRLVPIENAAMPDRTVIQWDKDDLDALSLLKVDVLGLGMLTAIRKAFDLVREFRGLELTMAAIPPEDPEVYAMIQRADTTGVFQIESRAQMAMLPRLRPACFYDLVIEVAIMRPGPIQGDMVHPYLRRRQGLEPVSYPSEAVRGVLERTLGVPIFQEQVIKLAMVAAGFTPGEADRLRRSMAAFRRRGDIDQFETRLIEGMRVRGYSEDFARQIFKQIEGFGEYGFPECVVGETRVVDADTGRWRTIEDILSGTTPLTHTLACDDDLRLRKRKVLAITHSGVKPVFCLQTALGYTVMATAEHPFFTVSGWRELKQLRAGDYIAAARSLPLAGRRRWPRHCIIVLADLIAEGNLCHPSTFYFYTTDARHRDEFARAVEHFPNTRAVLERHRSCFSVRVRRVHQRRLSGAVMWAQRLGIWGCDARGKFLPPEVFELRDSDIALLLARLWEGDVSFSQARHASYDTASRRLAKDVQHLLLRLGIVARLYRRVRSYRNRRIEHFTVTVTGKEPLQKFYRRIARRFLNPKKCRQARTLATQGADSRMSRDIIPVAVREIIRRKRDALRLTWEEIGRRTGLSIREIQSRGKHKKGFRRFVIGRLATCLRSRELACLANADLYWDRIVSIKSAGRRETYDLQIEGNHNFLANNLVVHNSHSASFALLVYVSAWLKRYEPEAFLGALLNSQPMGFYAPSQLVQDARRHGIEVRPADVRYSHWDSNLERGTDGKPAVRLGLHLIKGLTHIGAERLLHVRRRSPFTSVADLARRAGLHARDLEALANADALAGLSGHRHRARWSVAGVEPPLPLLAPTTISEALPMLRSPTEGENIIADYASLGLTLRRHPLALLRTTLSQRRILSAAEVRAIPHGQMMHTAGLVICRQHPSSGNGVVFVTLEDETGQTNLIIWPSIAARQRRELLNAGLLGVVGEVQREGEVQHVIARQLEDYSVLLGDLVTQSRDFR